MTLTQVAKTFWKHDKKEGLRYFFPIQRITMLNGSKQWFFMLPNRYNGHFSMRSVNKVRP